MISLSFFLFHVLLDEYFTAVLVSIVVFCDSRKVALVQPTSQSPSLLFFSFSSFKNILLNAHSFICSLWKKITGS